MNPAGFLDPQLRSARNQPRHLTLSRDGIEIATGGIAAGRILRLKEDLPERQSNIRNAFEYPAIRELRTSNEVRDLVTPVLGPNCFAVRAVFFNKTNRTNWKVSWHQDSVIAVQNRTDMPGWGPWSVKLGVAHVRPPATVLERMLAIRIHLDHCNEDNGPLRVLPASYHQGILSDSAIAALTKDKAITLTAGAGDVILMRPLLLHASSPAQRLTSRRVVHIEFAAEQLPHPMLWQHSLGTEDASC